MLIRRLNQLLRMFVLLFVISGLSGCYFREYSMSGEVRADSSRQFIALTKTTGLRFPSLGSEPNELILSDEVATIGIASLRPGANRSISITVIDRRAAAVRKTRANRGGDDLVLFRFGGRLRAWDMTVPLGRQWSEASVPNPISGSCGFVGGTGVVVRDPVFVDATAPPCGASQSRIAIYEAGRRGPVCTIDFARISATYPGLWPKFPGEGAVDKPIFSDYFRLVSARNPKELLLFRRSGNATDARFWPAYPPNQVLSLSECAVVEQSARFPLSAGESILDASPGADLAILTEQRSSDGNAMIYRVRVLGDASEYVAPFDIARHYYLDASHRAVYSYDDFSGGPRSLVIKAFDYGAGRVVSANYDMQRAFD